MLSAKVVITLDIHTEEFPMPADGDPSLELEDVLQDVMDEVYGTSVVSIKATIKGGKNEY